MIDGGSSVNGTMTDVSSVESMTVGSSFTTNTTFSPPKRDFSAEIRSIGGVTPKDPLKIPLPPTRQWKTTDFLGNYHSYKFKNQICPLPGAQVTTELEYEKAWKEYEIAVKEYESNSETAKARRRDLIEKSSTVHTRVTFEAVFGTRLRMTESLLNDREDFLEQRVDPIYDDTEETLRLWWTTIQAGNEAEVRHMVVAGFTSVDYKAPPYGNTALHDAVRRGRASLVRLLLELGAHPEIDNDLGRTPIHEAWTFWEMDTYRRTREQRLTQEATTETILQELVTGRVKHALVVEKQTALAATIKVEPSAVETVLAKISMKNVAEVLTAWVNRADPEGWTALHYACRFGTTRAVEILLNAQADPQLRTASGETAAMLADRSSLHEAARLLRQWDTLLPYLRIAKFSSQWKMFLSDFQKKTRAAMTESEVLLAEIDLKERVKNMERAARGGAILLDDPLVSDSVSQSEKFEVNRPPKPWEVGWRKFIANTERQQREECEALVDSSKKSLSLERQASFALDQLLDQLDNVESPPSSGREMVVPKDDSISTKSVGLIVKQSSVELPPLTVSRKQRQLPDRGVSLSRTERIEEFQAHEVANVKKTGTSLSPKYGKFSQLNTPTAVNISTGAELQSPMSTGKYVRRSCSSNSIVSDSLLSNDFFSKETIKTRSYADQSSRRQRQMNYAKRILQDAKYLQFTPVLTQNSAIGLSQRTPDAPIIGTDEDTYLRRLLSQGPSFEKAYAQQTIPTISQPLDPLLTTAPPLALRKNTIGAYSQSVYDPTNQRSQLASKLLSSSFT